MVAWNMYVSTILLAKLSRVLEMFSYQCITLLKLLLHRYTFFALILGRLYRAGTGYTVLPAILPAVEGIILRMLRALK